MHGSDPPLPPDYSRFAIADLWHGVRRRVICDAAGDGRNGDAWSKQLRKSLTTEIITLEMGEKLAPQALKQECLPEERSTPERLPLAVLI